MDYQILFLSALCLLILFISLFVYFMFLSSRLSYKCSIQEDEIDKLDSLLETAEGSLSRERAEWEKARNEYTRAANAREIDLAESRFHARQLESEIVSLKNENERIRRDFSQIHAALRDEFSLIAGRQLSAASQQMASENQQRFSSILNPFAGKMENLMAPLKHNIDVLRDQVARSNENNLMLSQRIKDVVASQQKLSAEAVELANALKNTKNQGCWGEMILEKCLEGAGLREHVDFIREDSFSFEGVRQRPDAIVNLPGGQKIVIDAKCSMNALVQFKNAADDGSREEYLRELLKNVTKQIDILSLKDYANIPQLASSVWDFVLMFLPSDDMFSYCFTRNPNLVQYAMNRHVIITTPSTLTACLLIVRQLWSEHDRSGKYDRAIKSFRDLCESIQTVMNRYEDLRKSFETSSRKLDDLNRAVYGSKKSLASQSAEMCSFVGYEFDTKNHICDPNSSMDDRETEIINADRIRAVH
jgi:DNA recombination protein RmuC